MGHCIDSVFYGIIDQIFVLSIDGCLDISHRAHRFFNWEKMASFFLEIYLWPGSGFAFVMASCMAL
jgi:hypothetical protein